MRIPLSQPSIGILEQSHVRKAIDAGWISGTGPAVREFEDRLCLLANRKYAIAVCNGTVALELALKTLGLAEKDEVIVPALTFAAPAAAVLNSGAKLILVDIDPVSWCLDPEKVARAITKHTRAIIAVDLLGHPANYKVLHDVIDDRDIEIIEDAAEAHGAWYEGLPCGAFGLMSTFSFHANKAISTGEGGALLTNSRPVAETARLFANHGMTADRPYYHVVAGHNYRMANLTAAVGCAQAQRWPELIQARLEILYQYADLLPAPFEVRPTAKWAKSACWLATFTIDHHRDGVVQIVRAQGIDARAIWPALVDLPLYKFYANEKQQEGYSVARKVSANAFWLPTWTGMPENLIEEVAQVVMQSVHAGRQRIQS